MNAEWLSVNQWAICPTVLTAAISFLVFAVVLGSAERLFRRGEREARRGVGTDLLFWAFTPILGKAITFAIVTAIVSWLLSLADRELDLTSVTGWGMIGRQSYWLQALEVLILADLIFYWVHRIFHGRSLWPFHAVHHSSTQMDWLSSMRFHPINDVATRLAQAIPLVLLGFSPVVVLSTIPIVVVFIIVTHADVPWTWGPLRYVFVSPVYHHWHHSSEPAAIDKNFSGVLVLWDWLFGTLYLPRGQYATVYGVVGGNYPDRFVRLLVYPFKAVARQISSKSSK